MSIKRAPYGALLVYNTAMRRLSTILLILGPLLLIMWGIHTFTYLRSIRLTDTLLSTFSRSTPSSVRIARVRIGARFDLPVIEAGIVNGEWLIAKSDANHVAQSSVPGEGGNIILYGHNTREVFGPIRWVELGEDVTLTITGGTVYQYKVIKTQEVSTSDTTLLKPSPTEVLTLYTCSGFFDSKRWVVRAVPVDNASYRAL